MACREGIEPPTYSLEGCCSIRLSYRQVSEARVLQPGRGGEIRTPDPLLPKQMRYQTALHPEKPEIIAGAPHEPYLLGDNPALTNVGSVMTTLHLTTIYISALVAANLLVAWLGPWFSPINAFFLIGLDLSLRDKLHDAWQGRHLALKVGGLVVAAGAISFVLNPATGKIAIASITAFILAMSADSLVYQLLRKRPWLQRSNGSNIVGAGVDSIIFPTIAFGGFMLPIVLMQFAAKVGGGAIWSVILNRPGLIKVGMPRPSPRA
jgi:queuosine precursor transporter